MRAYCAQIVIKHSDNLFHREQMVVNDPGLFSLRPRDIREITVHFRIPVQRVFRVGAHVPRAELETARARITGTWRLKLKQLFVKFWSDESGATAIEYGLIAAGISLAIIAIVNGLGTTLNEKFTSINTSLK